MKKKSSKSKRTAFTLLSRVSFAGTVYLLYMLYQKDSSLTVSLAVCTAIFTVSLLVLYRSSSVHTHAPSKKNRDTASLEEAPVSAPLNKEERDTIPEEPESRPDTAADTTAVQPQDIHSLFANPKPGMEMDIIAAARDAMESLAPFAEAQNIRLHLSTACDKLMIMAEPESIRILFRNIIDNSIKYMGRPGHMIITISLLGDDIFVILKDTGKGLSEDETVHVFELNFQGSNRVSGNGLGLTQTKMIVEAFGGTIYAKSSPENGMAIYIQLPVSGRK